MLDKDWKIAVLVGALIVLRIIVGTWKETPHRTFMVELSNSALIAFGLVFLLIRPLLLQAFFIPSSSMEATLHGPDEVTGRTGDRILVNKFIYRLGPPRRGDIVVFTAPPQAFYNQRNVQEGVPMDGGTAFIKRVIGLPGDKVQVIANDGVYINGKKLDEPYLYEGQPPYYNWPPKASLTDEDVAPPAPPYMWPEDKLGEPYIVPPDHILVMGDNRNNSSDSHLWRNPNTGEGMPALPIKNVLGKSLVIFWPLNRIAHLTK